MAEDDEYRPREDDHLVEPFFAGLGAEGDADSEAERDAVPEKGARGCGRAAVVLAALLGFGLSLSL